jgi:hypothetical protein
VTGTPRRIRAWRWGHGLVEVITSTGTYRGGRAIAETMLGAETVARAFAQPGRWTFITR